MKNNWLYWVGILVASLLIIWHVIYYFKLIRKEKEILETKDQIDDLEKNISKRIEGMLASSQGYLDRLVAKEEKPLRAKIERLQMERQFILDKLPIIGLFKK